MKKKTKTVKLIRYLNSASLVEYFDEEMGVNKRVILDSNLVDSAQDPDAIPVPAEQLEYAMQHGIPWELFTHAVLIKGEDIAKAMYRGKIYTKEDFEKNPSVILGIVHELAVPVLRQLNEIIAAVVVKESTDV